jgi:GT2 family glycosyltransferase
VSAAASPAQVWVIVLSWNNYDLTSACLRSLRKAAYPGARVLLVDNASKDDTPPRARAEFGPDIEILVNPTNLGFAQGNNVGIQYALEHGADYVLLLNNDTTVDPAFIGPLVARLQQNPRAGAVTAKIYYQQSGSDHAAEAGGQRFWAAGGQIRWWLGAARCRGQGAWDQGQYDQATQVDYAQGCAVLISRAALSAVGGLDSAFFAYFEDSDWSLRCRAAGYEIWYEPTSVVWHVAGQSLAAEGLPQLGAGQILQPQAYVLHIRNGLWFFRRHGRGLQRWVSLVSFTLQAAAFSFKLLLRGHAPAARGVWQGLAAGWAALPPTPHTLSA